MPVFDWQFIIVTLIAAGAAAVLVRRIMPARRRGDGPRQAPACEHCAANESATAKRSPARQPARTPTVPVVALRDLRETARSAKH